ncbi:hypothetical protein G9A89_001139 [Geosiphon pyriformis]|nr:hypothetical protein G9A89_001139 [Geosiphon pyriformis]
MHAKSRDDLFLIDLFIRHMRKYPKHSHLKSSKTIENLVNFQSNLSPFLTNETCKEFNCNFHHQKNLQKVKKIMYKPGTKLSQQSTNEQVVKA